MEINNNKKIISPIISNFDKRSGIRNVENNKVAYTSPQEPTILL